MTRLLKIARREYLSYLKTPGFWISLCVAPLVLGFALLGGPKALESAEPPPRLAVVDLTRSGFEAALRPALGGNPPLAEIVPPPAAAMAAHTPEQTRPPLRAALLAAGPAALEMAVVISGAPTQARVDLWTRETAPSDLAGVIQATVAERMRANRLVEAGLPAGLLKTLTKVEPEIRSFSPHARAGAVSFRDRAPALVAFGSAFVLWMAVVTGAGILLNSVIEEKAGRILEVLMSSASIPEILGGKILGVAALSGTVLAVWGALGLAVLLKALPEAVGAVAEALMAHGLVVWFALFFAGGYLMYASVFAAIGAFCETTREAQTLLGPLMILLSVPMLFLTVAERRPDAPLVVLLSWLPPFTPFLMVARIAGGLPLWQAGLGLAIMGATAAAVVWLCGRAFRAGALSGTGKPSLRRLLTAIARPVEG